jgi:hypothetical protein
MERLTNYLGVEYYKEKPEKCRPGTINDFIKDGKKRVGMEYLVYSELKDQYQVYQVREATTGAKIKAFIDMEVLYVFT